MKWLRANQVFNRTKNIGYWVKLNKKGKLPIETP